MIRSAHAAGHGFTIDSLGVEIHSPLDLARPRGDRRPSPGRSGRHTSICSGSSMWVRSAAPGQRCTIACQWPAVIARIRSAWRTSCSVSGWASCLPKSSPSSRMIATDSLDAGQPAAAEMPAERTTKPWSSNSSMRHFLNLRQPLPHQQLGHRAAARVAGADEQHHRAGQTLQRAFGDDAFAQDFEAIVVHSHHRRRLPVAARPIVQDQRHVVADRLAGLPRP